MNNGRPSTHRFVEVHRAEANDIMRVLDMLLARRTAPRLALIPRARSPVAVGPFTTSNKTTT